MNQLNSPLPLSFDSYDITDLITDVVYYLSAEEAYFLSLTCKKYNTIVYDISCLKVPDMSRVDKFRRLEHVHSSYNNDTVKNLSKLSRIKSLYTLDFNLEDRNIPMLTNLTSLSFITNDIKCIDALTNLTYLKIISNYTVKSVSKLTNLTHLSLPLNRSISNILMLTNLTTLNITSGSRSNGVTQISNLTNITSLNIGYNRSICDLTPLIKLKKVTLAHKNHLKSITFSSLSSIQIKYKK